MAITYIGSIDHVWNTANFSDPTTAGITWTNEAFLAVFNLLSSANAGTLGITRIAYNYGLNGTGLNYWDQGATTGNHCWAVFRFGSASTPFYMLVQASYGAPASPGAPGVTTYVGDGLMFAFAMRSDGGNPWNGTSNNNGADTKGTPVWTKGTSTTLMVWPRSNSDLPPAGAYATNKEAMVNVCTAAQGIGSISWANSASPIWVGPPNTRAHFIASADQFIAAVDPGCQATYNFVYFGKYSATVNPATNLYPYACLALNGLDRYTAYTFGQYKGGNTGYGPTSYTYYVGATALDGGIVDPVGNQTIACVWDVMNGFACAGVPFGQNDDGYDKFNLTNPAVLLGKNKYDVSNILIGAVNSDPLRTGATTLSIQVEPSILGEISFMKATTGIPTNSSLNGGRYHVIGSLNTFEVKFAIPWAPSYSGYGTNNQRAGYQFITTQ